MRKCRKESEVGDTWGKRAAERNGTITRPYSGAQGTAEPERSRRVLGATVEKI